MAGRLPRFNPLGLFKDALVQGQRQIGKAASDIRSVADELGRAGSGQSVSQEKERQPLQSPPSVPGPSKSKLPSETQEIATACVPCALGHFSRSAGALEEAKRFKHEGITSNEILDRIADVLKEQNTLERYDLTPMKLQNSPEWERELAEEALEESRQLRHLLEDFTDMKQLETAAARAATFYKRLNREWFQKRLARRASKADVTAENVSEVVTGQKL